MIDEFFDMEIPMAAGEVPANILTLSILGL